LKREDEEIFAIAHHVGEEKVLGKFIFNVYIECNTCFLNFLKILFSEWKGEKIEAIAEDIDKEVPK